MTIKPLPLKFVILLSLNLALGIGCILLQPKTNQELADIKKFKQLTPQQEALIRDIDSQKGLYAEAVLLGSRYQGLFRVIPPRYMLALLLNEKSEKAERYALEQQYDVLKAAEIVAERLENRVPRELAEDCFYED